MPAAIAATPKYVKKHTTTKYFMNPAPIFFLMLR